RATRRSSTTSRSRTCRRASRRARPRARASPASDLAGRERTTLARSILAEDLLERVGVGREARDPGRTLELVEGVAVALEARLDTLREQALAWREHGTAVGAASERRVQAHGLE